MRKFGRIFALPAIAAALACLAWPQPVQFSVYMLLHPLAPNQAIPGVSGGYVLAEPVPGHEGDLIFVATSGARRIEIHLLPRGSWTEAIHTPSFDVDYEGFGTNAPATDIAAVMGAVVAAIQANDPGNLRLDELARHAAPPSLLERVLYRLRGPRAFVAGVLLVALGVILARSPMGYVALALLLAGLGVWLRATSLGLPFSFDADVQRLFTAHLPLRDLVNTAALHDRHPPVLFLLLHAMERFGESEAVARLPAVIAGALIGPAILAASRWLQDDVPKARPILRSIAAVCAALVATVSPVLVDRSREVSELTLFGLLAVITLAASLRATRRPTGATLWLAAIGHALLLWTYYLAVFVLLGFWSAMRCLGRIDRRVVRAAVLGTVFGLPSLAFAALTLLRDYPTRQLARVFPQVVWGEQSVGRMGREVGYVILNALGGPTLAVLALVTAVALVRRNRTVIAPIAAAAAAAAGMLVLVGPARIQAYYVVSVLPLLLLALASFELPTAPAARWTMAAVLVLATAASVPQLLAGGADRIYSPDPAAFGRRFAQAISARPESTIAVAFAPDSTLLAYSLARVAGIEIDWRNLHDRRVDVAVDGLRQRFVPLLQPSALSEDSGQRAAATLAALARADDFLAIVDDPSSAPEIGAWLDRCAELDRTSTRRLLHCSQQQ